MKRQKTYISIDIEAALIRGKQYIIEIGAVKLLPDGSKETFSQLIQPYRFKKLNQRIQKLTGITTEQLLMAPSFKKAMRDFKDWCSGDYVILTFGEFDRKVLEEELARNYMKSNFLFPLVDFQQKYMIHHQMKEQPSLGGLMEELGLQVDTQHRALADADSLLRIFQAVEGEKIIEIQKTNEFSIILGSLKQQEETFTVHLSYIQGKINHKNIQLDQIESHVEELPFNIVKVIKTKENGEQVESEVIRIQSSKHTKAFLDKLIQSLHGEVVITRTGLKSLTRIMKLHDCVFPKTEVMTLQNMAFREELIDQFKFNGGEVELFESKVERLLEQNKGKIIDEYKKRALI